jgi:chromosome partitioning protein
MAAKTIALACMKGGSAKTTSTISLAAALAARGKTVLTVDMDPQGHLAEGFGIPLGDIPADISLVLERKIGLADIILTAREGIALAPSTLELAYKEPSIYNMKRREDRLASAVTTVADQYDYVLIDCPPSLGIFTINALSAASTVLIPMTADYYAMLGVEMLLSTVNEVRAEINPHLSLCGLLPTRVGRTTNAREVLDETTKNLGEKLRIFPPIPETVKFREAAALGKTIFEHAPDSAGAIAYSQLAETITCE